MSNYRRSSKPKTEHIKKGFLFQTIATIASILGLITASITIMDTCDKKDKKIQIRKQLLSRKFKEGSR